MKGGGYSMTLTVPSKMSKSSLVCSALATLDSRGQQPVGSPGQSCIHPFGFTKELCLWSREYHLLLCISLYLRGEKGFAPEFKHQSQFANP